MKNFIYYLLIISIAFFFFFSAIGFLDLSQGYEIHYRENAFLAFILAMLSAITVKISER